MLRFARDAGIHDADVPRAARLITRAVRRHVSGGALDEALDVLPPDLSQLVEPASTGSLRPTDADGHDRTRR